MWEKVRNLPHSPFQNRQKLNFFQVFQVASQPI